MRPEEVWRRDRSLPSDLLIVDCDRDTSHRLKSMFLARIERLLQRRRGRIGSESKQAGRVVPWFQVKGDKTLRLHYDLNEGSTVVDLGGYEGQWTSDIFAMYGCTILVFEPMKEYAENIRKRFARNAKIKIFDFGLSSENKIASLGVDADSSSLYKQSKLTTSVSLVKASEFFTRAGIETIALMKINIEGGEYDLLDHLIETGFVSRIDNIQVQFHDFVAEAESRMVRIQERLSQTHAITYQYPFVWENWRKL